jgi:hypothetical protein
MAGGLDLTAVFAGVAGLGRWFEHKDHVKTGKRVETTLRGSLGVGGQ